MGWKVSTRENPEVPNSQDGWRGVKVRGDAPIQSCVGKGAISPAELAKLIWKIGPPEKNIFGVFTRKICDVSIRSSTATTDPIIFRRRVGGPAYGGFEF